jgi:hypothetical protein
MRTAVLLSIVPVTVNDVTLLGTSKSVLRLPLVKTISSNPLHYEHIIAVVCLAYPNRHVDVSKRIGGIIVKTADHTHTSYTQLLFSEILYKSR